MTSRPQNIVLLVEELPVAGIVAVSAFDEDQIPLCDAAHPCGHCAINECLSLLPSGSYNVDIRVLNPTQE
jgi:hypothetical protein